jgi:hypothetical protein
VSEQTRKTLLEQVGSQADPRTENAGTQAAAQSINTAAEVAAKQKPANPANPSVAREKQDALLAGLLLGSPEFQRR